MSALEKKRQDIIDWLCAVDITGTVANEYATKIIENGCGSIERLKKKVIADKNFLLNLQIDQSDAEELYGKLIHDESLTSTQGYSSFSISEETTERCMQSQNVLQRFIELNVGIDIKSGKEKSEHGISDDCAPKDEKSEHKISDSCAPEDENSEHRITDICAPIAPDDENFVVVPGYEDDEFILNHQKILSDLLKEDTKYLQICKEYTKEARFSIRPHTIEDMENISRSHRAIQSKLTKLISVRQLELIELNDTNTALVQDSELENLVELRLICDTSFYKLKVAEAKRFIEMDMETFSGFIFSGENKDVNEKLFRRWSREFHPDRNKKVAGDQTFDILFSKLENARYYDVYLAPCWDWEEYTRSGALKLHRAKAVYKVINEDVVRREHEYVEMKLYASQAYDDFHAALETLRHPRTLELHGIDTDEAEDNYYLRGAMSRALCAEALYLLNEDLETKLYALQARVAMDKIKSVDIKASPLGTGLDDVFESPLEIADRVLSLIEAKTSNYTQKFPRSSKVEIFGTKDEHELNGKQGEVVSFDSTTGRYAVKVSRKGSRKSETLSFRGQNLKSCHQSQSENSSSALQIYDKILQDHLELGLSKSLYQISTIMIPPSTIVRANEKALQTRISGGVKVGVGGVLVAGAAVTAYTEIAGAAALCASITPIGAAFAIIAVSIVAIGTAWMGHRQIRDGFDQMKEPGVREKINKKLNDLMDSYFKSKWCEFFSNLATPIVRGDGSLFYILTATERVKCDKVKGKYKMSIWAISGRPAGSILEDWCTLKVKEPKEIIEEFLERGFAPDSIALLLCVISEALMISNLQFSSREISTKRLQDLAKDGIVTPVLLEDDTLEEEAARIDSKIFSEVEKHSDTLLYKMKTSWHELVDGIPREYLENSRGHYLGKVKEIKCVMRLNRLVFDIFDNAQRRAGSKEIQHLLRDIKDALEIIAETPCFRDLHTIEHRLNAIRDFGKLFYYHTEKTTATLLPRMITHGDVIDEVLTEKSIDKNDPNDRCGSPTIAKARSYEKKARSLKKEHNLVESRRLMKKAIELYKKLDETKSVEGIFRLVRCYLELQQIDKAKKLLIGLQGNAGIHIDREYAFLKGKCFLCLEDFNLAEHYLETAKQHCPPVKDPLTDEILEELEILRRRLSRNGTESLPQEQQVWSGSIDVEHKVKAALSICGGGIRGIIPAVFLREFERTSKMKCADVFDVFAGTSTGAVVACGLVFDNTAGKLVNYYKEQGKEIFKRKSAWTIFREGLYDPAGRLSLFHREFGLRTLGDAKKSLVIPAGVTHTRQSVIFKSTDHADVAVVDALMATTAAPYYFPPYRYSLPGQNNPQNNPSPAICIDGFDLMYDHEDNRQCWIDGGILLNDPVEEAKTELDLLYPEKSDWIILSIGTGSFEEPNISANKKRSIFNMLGEANKVVNYFLDGNENNTNRAAQASYGERMFRWQPDLLQAISMDDCSEMSLTYMEEVALTYLDELEVRNSPNSISNLMRRLHIN